MRLTAQVLNDAPIVFNPEGLLTIQLRDLQIPYLENLGITQDKYSTIDLTNNDLTEFDNVPRLKSLETLLLGNNHIYRLSESNETTFVDNLPRLRSISLINNNLGTFSSLKVMRGSKIENLILMGNPIATSKHYRSFVIWLLPSLKVLDCSKVKKAERDEAIILYGNDYEEQTPLAQKLLSDANSGESGVKDTDIELMAESLTDEERAKLIEQLESSTSIDEIDRIESILKNGHM